MRRCASAAAHLHMSEPTEKAIFLARLRARHAEKRKCDNLKAEVDELLAVMTHEPVHDGNRLAFATAMISELQKLPLADTPAIEAKRHADLILRSAIDWDTSVLKVFIQSCATPMQ